MEILEKCMGESMEIHENKVWKWVARESMGNFEVWPPPPGDRALEFLRRPNHFQ